MFPFVVYYLLLKRIFPLKIKQTCLLSTKKIQNSKQGPFLEKNENNKKNDHKTLDEPNKTPYSYGREFGKHPL